MSIDSPRGGGSVFEKILVALDGSALSERALGTLAPVLAAPGAKLLVARGVPGGPIANDAAAQAPVLAYLREVVSELAKRGVRASGHMLVGDDPAVQISAFAAEAGASMIALATHGRSGVLRLALGSIAERLVRIADRPVLLVNPAVAGAPLSLERILVPLDGSEGAEAALAVACEIARAHSSELVLHHVEDGAAEVELAVGGDATRAERAFERARSRLAGRVAEERVRTVATTGSPAATILATIAETRCGAVVMGTHGRTGLARVALGSVAEAVIRGAPVPVIVQRLSDLTAWRPGPPSAGASRSPSS